MLFLSSYVNSNVVIPLKIFYFYCLTRRHIKSTLVISCTYLYTVGESFGESVHAAQITLI